MKVIDTLKDRIRYIDRTYWLLFGALIVVAVIALFSASSSLVYQRGSILGPVGEQMKYIVLGLILAFGMQLAPTWLVRPIGYIVWGTSVICLYLMLIPHSPFVITLNGAGRWFNLFGIMRFQPSEFAKWGLVIVMADQLSRIRSESDKRTYFYRTLIMSGVTIFPVLTGNLSTAILMCLIVGTMWFLARLPWKYILTTAGILITLMVTGYCVVEFAFVRQHRQLPVMTRAITWVSRVDAQIEEMSQPEEDFKLTDENYQRSMAKVAIARGGKTPFGVLPGNSQERDYLPLAYADYIFAIIVEETGIIGAVFLIFLYLAILFRACLASSRYSDCAASLMVMGLALMLTCQALISMMVAVGIGPVTGQPLPMVSRGGTSVLITAAYFGIMMCVSREQKELSEKTREAAERSMDTAPTIEIEE